MKAVRSHDIQTFAQSIREHLNECAATGVIEGFVCTLNKRCVYAASLFNGLRHSKGPLQENRPFQLEVSLVMPGGRGVGFTLESVSFKLFLHQLEFALSQSVKLQHRLSLKKQESYPSLPLASEELLHLFENDGAAAETSRILDEVDVLASQVKHPRLMNREVSVSLASHLRMYFDSVGNHAEERSAACSAMVSYALEDSGESHSDLFGKLPRPEELCALVEEAAKNITRTAIKPLGEHASWPVLLTHKAVGDLFEQLVLPNLETRALLDKTGAWSFEDCGTELIPALTIEDNPHLQDSPFSAVFDFEGSPTQPVQIVTSGVLLHPLMTSALLAEVESTYPERQGQFHLTGHADSAVSTSHTNLFIRLEMPPLPDLSSASYVQIQNLTGMSVDPLTGQFALDSDGAKVFVDGRLAYSTSLTLRGNFFEALKQSNSCAGPMVRHFNVWTPSLFTHALSCVSKELAQTFEDDAK
ncbi:MAG: hypothetical protein RIR26_2535 [Pseudomonadota bacterium]|jgi:predicted Zn-dependent protease